MQLNLTIVIIVKKISAKLAIIPLMCVNASLNLVSQMILSISKLKIRKIKIQIKKIKKTILTKI